MSNMTHRTSGSLPRQSAKRIAAIKDGTWKPAPRKPMPRTVSAQEGAKLLRGTSIGPTKSERGKAKKRAWDAFSKFIRLRDADANGRVKCVTCSRGAHWKDMDAGHYITRAKEATMFDERNVNAQCGGCNRWQGGKMLEHELAVDRIHGVGTAAVLKQKAMMPCKRTVADYTFIADTYTSRVANIKATEPGKYNRP